ncbi:hypothetical protein [Sphingobium sp. Sx8-8]|uniref:hypothetical protein n=1 Tax=Sphingobium sp. Sx8-8 TaxID=2933617 RepID=UPI001F575644|nr:hypothetical protein [Sphingobium sp. Sx8-8]
MGSRFSFLFAAPLLLATPVLAQQENGAEPVFNLPQHKPQTDTNRQGPELDIFRGAPATAVPPPVVLPTIQVPPPASQPTATPAPQPAPQQPQRRPAPAGTAGASQERPLPKSETPPLAPAPGETAPAPVENQALPPAENAAAPAAPETVPLAPAEESASRWPWIAAAAAAALVGTFLWFRRRKPEEYEEPAYEAAPQAAPKPSPAPRPQPTPAPVPPAPRPEPVQPATDRPWLDLAMEVQAARLTLMGATIGYTLRVHNRGTRPAGDILIRSLIANADAQQQALFEHFFAGETGLPVHSAVAIAPGETQILSGELRLDAQQIAAIPMGQRALLIPLIAFDAQYRWTDEAGGTQGTGRTGRVFIIGEEQTPPADRLSPFRLDLGPRQYRTPGSRATALSLAS